MPRIPLTEIEADRIIAAQKSIRDDLTWTSNPNEAWWKSEIRVTNDLGVDLRVYANVNMKEPTRFSYSLSLSRNFRILGLDVNGAHVNKHTNREEWLPGTHMQRWTDQCRNRFAYTPEEEISQDIEEAFHQFCTECNIDFQGQVRPLPARQLGLGEVP
jgi:hypothetical protein